MIVAAHVRAVSSDVFGTFGDIGAIGAIGAMRAPFRRPLRTGTGCPAARQR